MTPHVGSVGVLFDAGAAASAPANAVSASKVQADALNPCALSLPAQSPFCLLLQMPGDFSI